MLMKNSEFKNRLAIFLILMFVLSFPVRSQASIPEGAVRWRGWEFRLTAQNETGEAPASVEVIFESPAGKSFSGAAFTDDGVNYFIRAAFPEIGSWRWKTVCSDHSDRGLHNVRGKVEVVKYVGDNALYHHGDIRISPDKRFLIHEDGTPFLWIGDTGWNATYNSTMEEWKTYINMRAEQRFTVIQVSPRGVGNRSTASARPDVSFRTDGTIDPAFWQDLDDKIRYANDRGMLVLLVGVGSAWRDAMAANPRNQKFETYVAGRFASHMVVFSPSFDQLFANELDLVAFELQKWTQHLVTQHPGTNHDANLTYRSSNSVDFSGLQSGHHGGDLTKVYSAARQWTLDLWGGAPVKPVILIEAMYDGYGNNNAISWREKDSRKPGWIAWMSGARGFTYGAGDIPPKVPKGNGAVWMFNKADSTYDYWLNAIEWRSAWQMTNMRLFMEAIEWWKLMPSPELVRNQETADTLQMMAARTPDYNIMVAYLPDNPRVILDLTMFVGAYSTTWFNPATGEYLPAKRISGAEQNKVFERPEGWDDAVLKLIKL